MQQNGGRDGIGGGQQPPHRPVEGVEKPYLAVCQKGRTHEQVRVPQGNTAVLQCLGCCAPVGIKVQKGVSPRQNEVAKSHFVEKKQDEGSEEREARSERRGARSERREARSEKHYHPSSFILRPSSFIIHHSLHGSMRYKIISPCRVSSMRRKPACSTARRTGRETAESGKTK